MVSATTSRSDCRDTAIQKCTGHPSTHATGAYITLRHHNSSEEQSESKRCQKLAYSTRNVHNVGKESGILVHTRACPHITKLFLHFGASWLYPISPIEVDVSVTDLKKFEKSSISQVESRQKRVRGRAYLISKDRVKRLDLAPSTTLDGQLVGSMITSMSVGLAIVCFLRMPSKGKIALPIEPKSMTLPSYSHGPMHPSFLKSCEHLSTTKSPPIERASGE
ncbi:hypothetical protein V8F20_011647 [Naviculisporaceae sp. PSN 640]